jgi:hypothetical protein
MHIATGQDNGLRTFMVILLTVDTNERTALKHTQRKVRIINTNQKPPPQADLRLQLTKACYHFWETGWQGRLLLSIQMWKFKMESGNKSAHQRAEHLSHASVTHAFPQSLWICLLVNMLLLST